MMKRVPNLTVTSAAKVHDNTKWPVWYGDGVKSLLSFIGALGGGSPAGVAAQLHISCRQGRRVVRLSQSHVESRWVFWTPGRVRRPNANRKPYLICSGSRCSRPAPTSDCRSTARHPIHPAGSCTRRSGRRSRMKTRFACRLATTPPCARSLAYSSSVARRGRGRP